METLEAYVQAHPDDAAGWAVYADWLLEHGDSRGELVRRPRALTADELVRFRGPIPAAARVSWQHGFVVGVELPVERRTPELLARILAHRECRFLTALRLYQRTWRDDDIFDGDRYGDPDEHALAACLALELARLRTLGLCYLELGDADIARLIAMRLPELGELDLRYSQLDDARFARIAGAPWFARVRRLHLQRNPLTEHTAALLAGRAFELLDIRYTAIASRSVVAATLLADGDRPLPCAAATVAPPVGTRVDGLTISPQPTGRFTAVRYVDASQLDAEVAARCAHVEHLAAVYVDPDEWSFRTFENIVPLDRLFETCHVELAAHEELAHEVHRFAVRAELPALDELPLYTVPLDAAARGGRRYIFHSARLADALTGAVRAALPLPGFSHVNPVFRCNRFEPGDEPFHAHRDTPYFDRAAGHVSPYTLLVYLTGGTGTPALRIEDIAIERIAPLTAIVFHQAYEHAAMPYTDGRKVFLRTELVFQQPGLVEDLAIGARFAQACYYTGESLRLPALAAAADRAYNAVAAAHWTGVLPASREPFVHKQLGALHWLANGYDFWFPRGLPLAECAAVALLDVLNATVAERPFRALVASEVVADADPEAFAAAHPCATVLPTLDKAALFPPCELLGSCCPTHSHAAFDATRSDEVVKLYTRAQARERGHLEPAPIVLLGQQIYLDPSRFVIDGDKIHVLSRDRLAPVNFAACWNSGGYYPDNYLGDDVELTALRPLVPPILWRATPAAHHLMFDFFANSWAVRQRDDRVQVPRIRLDPVRRY